MKVDLKSVIAGLFAVLFVSFFNPAFGVSSQMNSSYTQDYSNYSAKVYPSTGLLTGFTIHGDINNATTILMRSSHLLSIDQVIQGLGPGSFTKDPNKTKQDLHGELMSANNLVLSDSPYAVWNKLTEINKTLPSLLSQSGQNITLPLFNGMLNSIKLDTAPTTPAATTEPQIQQPPLLFYPVMILLAIAIGITIAFPFRVTQVKKKMIREGR
jgi:hypothetical protein